MDHKVDYETFKEAITAAAIEKYGELNIKISQHEEINWGTVDRISLNRVSPNKNAMILASHNIKKLYDWYTKVYVPEGEFEKMISRFVDDLEYGDINEDSISGPYPLPEEKMMDGRILPRLCNAKLNKKLLDGIPHRIVGDDLALYYVREVYVREAKEGTITGYTFIKNEYNIPEEELYRIAFDNVTPSAAMLLDVIMAAEEFKPCTSVMTPIEDFKFRKGCPVPLIRVGNGFRFDGAAAILKPGTLEKLFENIGSDFYVIPASVHEMLVCPDNGEITIEVLSEIVLAANGEVSKGDFLSNSVYKYTKEKGFHKVA